MKPIRTVTTILLGASTLGLSACGEGWEPQELRGRVPYVEERTAGPGVEYVRAYMLPEKGPKLEPQMPAEENPIKDADPIFEHGQKKGGAKPAIKDADPMFDKGQKGKK
jgi:hypothetical protein